jgi:hypothetical protein
MRVTVRFVVAGAAAAAAAGVGALARADQYEFTFSGVLAELYGGAMPAPWGSLAAGSPWEIAVRFDSAAPDQQPHPYAGRYDAIGFSVNFGGIIETGSGGVIDTLNDGPSGSGALRDRWMWTGSVPSNPQRTFQVFLTDDDAAAPDALASDALPLSLAPGLFGTERVGMVYFAPGPGAYGTIDQFSARIVPAPGGAAAVLAGCAAAIAGRRRRAARSPAAPRSARADGAGTSVNWRAPLQYML